MYLAEVCAVQAPFVDIVIIIVVILIIFFQAELNKWLSTHAELVFPIDCSWALELNSGFDLTSCLTLSRVQACSHADIHL